MKLVEIQWNPSARQLRQFGVVCLFVLPLIGWMWHATPTTIGMLGAAGLVVGVTSLLFPKAVKPVFIGLSILDRWFHGVLAPKDIKSSDSQKTHA